MSFAEKIEIKCPTCSRKLRPVDFMHTATIVVYRTCQGCRHAWCLKVRPIVVDATRGVAAHELDWQPLPPDRTGARVLRSLAMVGACLTCAMVSQLSTNAATCTRSRS